MFIRTEITNLWGLRWCVLKFLISAQKGSFTNIIANSNNMQSGLKVSSQKKFFFENKTNWIQVRAIYKVSLSGLDLFRRSWSGRMFSVRSDIRSHLFRLLGPGKLFCGTDLGESGGEESTTGGGSGRKSSGWGECAMATVGLNPKWGK